MARQVKKVILYFFVQNTPYCKQFFGGAPSDQKPQLQRFPEDTFTKQSQEIAKQVKKIILYFFVGKKKKLKSSFTNYGGTDGIYLHDRQNTDYNIQVSWAGKL